MVAPTARSKDFLSVLDLDSARVCGGCLELAAQLKRERRLGLSAPTATRSTARHVALLFEKPSLRTRSTFEIAVRELGGDVLAPSAEFAARHREPVDDVARNLERWVDALVIRHLRAGALRREFAAATPRLHVINALTDEQHPCQALADSLTLRSAGAHCAAARIAFVGDGNNVATSLAHAARDARRQRAHRHPEGYELPDAVVEEARSVARARRAPAPVPRSARRRRRRRRGLHRRLDVDGPGSGGRAARRDFAPYQVNDALMASRRAATRSSCTACRPIAARK